MDDVKNVEKVFGKRIPNNYVDSAESVGKVDDSLEHQDSQLSHTSLSFGDLVYAFVKKKKLSLTGDWIYRDIKLFIPEAIIYGVVVFLGVLIFAMVELVNFFWLQGFQTRASEAAFIEVSQQMATLTQFHAVSFGLLVLVTAGFFLFKTFFLMPNKNRVPVLRAFRGGILRPSVDTFKDNCMKFWGKPVGDKINVDEPRLHVDWNTGLPYLVLVEGKGSNKSILQGEKNDLTSIEWSGVLSSAVSTQQSIDEWKFLKKQPLGGFNPAVLVVGGIVVLILIGAAMYLMG